jgi:hypothetical protein
MVLAQRAVPWQELQVTICGSIFKLLLSRQGCVCCTLYCTLQGMLRVASHCCMLHVAGDARRLDLHGAAIQSGLEPNV